MRHSIEDLGYKKPTLIQKKVIPIIKKEIDTIVIFKSQTGKIATFVLPMLNKLNKFVKPNYRVLRGLIITATDELVEQISDEITKYGKYLEIKHDKINKTTQIENLSNETDIIVGTLAQLNTLIANKKLEFNSINMLVFYKIDNIPKIKLNEDIKFLFSKCSKKRQVVIFSTTNSQNIKKVFKKFLFKPVTIKLSRQKNNVILAKHIIYKINQNKKDKLLKSLVKQNKNKQIIIFVNQKDIANKLNILFANKKIKNVLIHEDLSYIQQTKNLKIFKSKQAQILIISNIITKKINIKKPVLIINYEIPDFVNIFIDRINKINKINKKIITLLTIQNYEHFTNIKQELKLNTKEINKIKQ